MQEHLPQEKQVREEAERVREQLLVLTLEAIYEILLDNTNPHLSMHIAAGKTLPVRRGYDADEFLFVFGLIPEKYRAEDYTPNFARKLKGCAAWLEYVLNAFADANLEEPDEVLAFWDFYLTDEQRNAVLASAMFEKQAAQETVSEHNPIAIRIEQDNGQVTITITLPGAIKDVMSLVNRIVNLVDRSYKNRTEKQET